MRDKGTNPPSQPTDRLSDSLGQQKVSRAGSGQTIQICGHTPSHSPAQGQRHHPHPARTHWLHSSSHSFFKLSKHLWLMMRLQVGSAAGELKPKLQHNIFTFMCFCSCDTPWTFGVCVICSHCPLQQFMMVRVLNLSVFFFQEYKCCRSSRTPNPKAAPAAAAR